ncbi:unnamed protein product [Adineta steineri]|uniref:Uncharacterized protein n=3 Tax=Adineta steineri TaxID=433720 RepID=A0A818YQW3_9BILA|nr:unnamed protein product [Adineta steineri]CAF3760061.1 unnamed protein product [Adineta steineri]
MIASARANSSRNKTGVYGAPSRTQSKSPENKSTVVSKSPSQNRTIHSAKLLLALSEQKHHYLQQALSSSQELSQYQTVDGNNHTITDSHSNIDVMRNGFRPSIVRRQKQHIINTMNHRDNQYQNLQDLSIKQSFTPSVGSARLKSEIEHLSSKIKLQDTPNNKSPRSHRNRDMSGTPRSILSNFTSNRPSSASTNTVATRNHERVSTTTRLGTANTSASISGVDNNSCKSPQTLVTIPTAASTTTGNEDYSRHYINHHVAHAYQVPQQSNIGNESALPSTSLTTTIKQRATKMGTHNNEKNKVACPFYVMYFTNLSLQQNSNDNENDKRSSATPLPTTRKGTANSRIGTSHSRHSSTRKHVSSPLSMNSRSVIDEDDENSLLSIAPYYNKKRFSARIAAFEHENSHLLKDVLRTTAWNHVQM